MGRKIILWILQAINWRVFPPDYADMDNKGKFTRKIKSLLAQNNDIMANYIKVINDYTQLNSQCCYSDEPVNLIINECSKLAQKNNKTKHDWMKR